ncbi:MAG: hypothetical protein PHT13_15740, partial [Methanosarcina sp.]|nr:hypothetical protein [Methanosarcina sp.]
HEIGIFWSQLKENLFFENLATKISVTSSFPGVDYPQLCYDPLLVACISDIHGNLPALEAVITDARSRGVFYISHPLIKRSSNFQFLLHEPSYS